MSHDCYDVAVIGAGIAGVATAHALLRNTAGKVLLVERDAPLSLTSDKSTECYRNFWPGPDSAMAALVNDSIERLYQYTEQSGNQFQLHQRGYLFATARGEEIEQLEQLALINQSYDGGRLRRHTSASTAQRYRKSPAHGFDRSLDGADLLTDPAMIRQHFPYLSQQTRGVLHTRKCGVLSAQQLGMYLLEQARAAGVDFLNADFSGVQTSGGQLSAIALNTASGTRVINTRALVLCSGPHLRSTASIAGSTLPVQVEKHVKISLADPSAVIPRNAPLTIWNDPTDLGWSADERATLAASPETKHLTGLFPAGVHGRPIGAGNQITIYWTYDAELTSTPRFPIEAEPWYAEILLRGMAQMVPGLTTYLDPMPKPYIDGGYYTKAADNRPLIGPLDVPGTFVCSALSGYGIMSSCGAADLLCAHVQGTALPHYAAAFAPARFNDPGYLQKIAGLTESGQI